MQIKILVLNWNIWNHLCANDGNTWNHLSSSGFYRSWGPQSENERKTKDWQIIGKLKRMSIGKGTMIPLVTVELWIVHNGGIRRLEELDIRGRIYTLKNTALLRSDRILRRVRVTWGDLLSLWLQWKKKHQLILVSKARKE